MLNTGNGSVGGAMFVTIAISFQIYKDRDHPPPQEPGGAKQVVMAVTYDISKVKSMESHYDRHAGKFESSNDARKSRREGPAAPLKIFHNRIKTALIQRFAGGVDRLLDMCCGRGGDLWKWADAGVRFVRGIDLSPMEIEDARHRFEQMRAERAKKGLPNDLEAEFEATDQLGMSQYMFTHHRAEIGTFDAVSCMFAAHYFFIQKAAIKMFLSNVSVSLREGGIFFGTIAGGSQVIKTLGTAVDARGRPVGVRDAYREEMLVLKKKWAGEHQPFGSTYTCAIKDTVTEGHEDDEGSFEFLVFFKVFKDEAVAQHLFPLEGAYGPDLEAMTTADPKYPSFRQFKPNFPGSHKSLEVASQLFYTFAFQKRTPGGEASGAPPSPIAAPQRSAPPGGPSSAEGPYGGGTAKRPAMEGGEGAAAAAAPAAKKKRPTGPPRPGGAGNAAGSAGGMNDAPYGGGGGGGDPENGASGPVPGGAAPALNLSLEALLGVKPSKPK